METALEEHALLRAANKMRDAQTFVRAYESVLTRADMPHAAVAKRVRALEAKLAEKERDRWETNVMRVS